MDGQIHPETLEESPPPVLENAYISGITFIEKNGWYLLAGFLFLWYAWVKLRPLLSKWQEEIEERKFAAACHKNPDLFQQREEALEAARLRMQEEYKKQAEIAAEKRKQREQLKKEENIQRYKVMLGRRLDENDDMPKRNNSFLRPDYNPLMGSGGSGGYRPPRRSCSSGGCG